MKKLLLILLFSGSAMAQSMIPGEIKEYVVKPVNQYQIKLTNFYKKNVCYEVSENDKPVLRPNICLSPGASQTITVFVHTNPDSYGEKTVCTMPQLNGNVKVKMCSKIRNYYPASQLSQ